MIKININNTKSGPKLIDPCEMINSAYGTIFQQYFNGIQSNDFYISCGLCEKNIIHIWYSEEDKKYQLSTDDLKSLKGLVDRVKVCAIDATIELNINI